MQFHDRTDAGQQLARLLASYAGRTDLVVIALPRGGVPVACEVAKSLHAPLDIMVVRKLGVPGHEELALGAIAPNGALVVNPEVMARLRDPEEALQEAIRRESTELQRRELEYRSARPRVTLRGKTVIVVDDGLATGATMHAAVQALEHEAVGGCIVAVPVAGPEARRTFAEQGVEVISVLEPEEFRSVGEHYEDFSQTTDQEVRQGLHDANNPISAP